MRLLLLSESLAVPACFDREIGRVSNGEGTIIRTVGMTIGTVGFTRTRKLFPLVLLNQNEARSVSSSNSILMKKGGHPWPGRWDECGR